MGPILTPSIRRVIQNIRQVGPKRASPPLPAARPLPLLRWPADPRSRPSQRHGATCSTSVTSRRASSSVRTSASGLPLRAARRATCALAPADPFGRCAGTATASSRTPTRPSGGTAGSTMPRCVACASPPPCRTCGARESRGQRCADSPRHRPPPPSPRPYLRRPKQHDYNASQITPEWHAWVQHVRHLPPTQDPVMIASKQRWMTVRPPLSLSGLPLVAQLVADCTPCASRARSLARSPTRRT